VDKAKCTLPRYDTILVLRSHWSDMISDTIQGICRFAMNKKRNEFITIPCISHIIVPPYLCP
jgi:hypothetical protein